MLFEMMMNAPDTRAYPEINGVEVEVDLELMDFNYKTQKFSGLGTVMEGPLKGEEIVLTHELIKELVEGWEREHEEGLF